ncbi:hypothetical protein IWX49DRAFT_255692 [Phyllosticta citricarpa]|uniref:PinX1-related protein 1 n=2 Tax=Phyllosticta TaxID=121621 RepID=A0ABR1LPQ2_9PEZI
MGLAAPKNRFKISADPNNTTWSKNTDRFGHKILTKQGWNPGEFLGAKDANHSEHYTAANASHIRVKIKDDTLGLGRKKGGAENDNFGLSLFQGVLGRLNGKSDAELKTESDARKRLESKLYGGTGLHFVFGGYLVGDKIEDLKKNEAAADKTSKSQASSSPSDESKPEKKRKRSGDDEEAPKLKKKKRKSDLKADYSATSSPDDSEGESKKKSKSKKSKKAKSKDKAQSSESEDASAAERKDKDKDDKKARKEAKKAQKAERRAKKEARRLKKEKRKQEKAKKEEDSDSSSSSESEADAQATESDTKTGGPAFAGNRLAVRQRYIRQKKMASMDTQALKEIFMVKSQA